LRKAVSDYDQLHRKVCSGKCLIKLHKGYVFLPHGSRKTLAGIGQSVKRIARGNSSWNR